MKILTIVLDLGLGGTQRTAENFSSAYLGAGHQVVVLCTEALGERAVQLENQGAKVLLKTGDWLSEVISFQPDIVHVHSLKISRETLLPIHQTVKATWVETNVFSRPSDYEDLLDWSLQLSDWASWVYFCRRGFRKGPKVRVLGNAIDCNRFFRSSDSAIAEFCRGLGIQKEHSLIYGRAGQPHPTKWDAVVIDAFCQLFQGNSFLLLLGASDDIREKVSSLPEIIKNNIHLLQPKFDDAYLCDFYSSLDLFVHASSQGESFGLVLIESMLCNTPVLTLATPHSDNSQLEIISKIHPGLVAANKRQFSACWNDWSRKLDSLRTLGAAKKTIFSGLYNKEHLAAELVRLCQSEEKSITWADSMKAIVHCQLRIVKGWRFLPVLLLRPLFSAFRISGWEKVARRVWSYT